MNRALFTSILDLAGCALVLAAAAVLFGSGVALAVAGGLCWALSWAESRR